MVLQEQTHQFLISDAITNETHLGGQRFNAYGSDLRANTTFSSIHSLGERMSRSIGSDISHSRHLMDLLGAPNEVNHHSQGLSLSLGSRLLLPSGPYDPGSLNLDALGPNCIIPGGSRNEIPFASTAFPCSALCGTNCLSAAAVGNSVYMKPTQSLLEETVSVGGEAIDLTNDGDLSRLSLNARRNRRQSSELKAELCGDGLSFAENHVVRSRIAKLIALLEEVDSRHEEYYQQMEEVVSSFEAIAGFGAAKSYTALALQAMSRHFCNLRDAILSQINSARRKVPEGLPKISTGLSQLSLFDQENRRNHQSLQQIGMVQNPRQAWRPIRGLPETSVAFLRAWLFEHFLHPYPNDSEKIMLASQTGLTKNQVSNWFINARVRLWKPMIEEMYKEEFADSSVDIENDPLFAGSAVSRESDTDHSNEFTGVGSI